MLLAEQVPFENSQLYVNTFGLDPTVLILILVVVFPTAITILFTGDRD